MAERLNSSHRVCTVLCLASYTWCRVSESPMLFTVSVVHSFSSLWGILLCGYAASGLSISQLADEVVSSLGVLRTVLLLAFMCMAFAHLWAHFCWVQSTCLCPTVPDTCKQWLSESRLVVSSSL